MNTSASRLVAALLVLSIAVALPAQDRKFGAKAYVTAIELVIDVVDPTGRTPRDLTPADFVIVEDGVEREVTSVEYLGGGIPIAKNEGTPAAAAPAEASDAPRAADWQIVIWFDGITTSRGTIHEAVNDLKKQVPTLVSMGSITILYSDLNTNALITSSRNTRAIADALDAATKQGNGDRLTRLRTMFVRESEHVDQSGGLIVNPISNDITHYVSEELRLLSIARTNLLRWLSRVPRRQPRMLMFVGGGFDLNPVEFYSAVYESTPEASDGRDVLKRSENQVALDDENNRLAKLLATEGWIAVAVGGTGAYSMTTDVERQGDRQVAQTGTNNSMPVFLYTAPAAPLQQFARETGGTHVMNAKQLPRVIDRLRNRVRLTYQVDREPDLAPRKVRVRARRRGLDITAPLWSSSSTNIAVMEVRALDLLENPGRAEQGDLAVQAYAVPNENTGVTERAGTLRARIDLSPLKLVASQIGATKMRFTVAFNESNALPSFVHNTMDVADLGKLDAIEWTAPFTMPATTDTAAVVVEELTTGAWGSVRVKLDGSISETQVAQQPLEPTPAEWLTDRADAMARAAREGKVVFAFHRDDECRACAKLLKDSSAHPTVRRLASNFVLLVTPPARAAAPGLETPAAFGVIDQTGLEPLTWRAENDRRELIGVGELADIMQRADASAVHVRQSASERVQGRTTDAYLSLGWAFRQAGDTARASEAYAAAARSARAGGDLQQAQSADVLYALAEASRGKVQESVSLLRSITRAPFSKRTESEAYLALGQVLRASGDEREAAHALERASADVASAVLPAQESRVLGGNTRVRLLVPNRAPYSGTIQAQALARDPSIASVVFLLDGAQVANDVRPPFDTPVDLGSVPRRHELRIVARNAAGALVGDDAMILNDRNDEFWVRLSLGERRVANATLNLPSGGTLSKLEFFLDDRLIATRSAPPYSVPVGETNEGSTLRVAATLSDGRNVEDALLVGVGSELIEVQEVELFATVLDKRDEVVRDLDRSQFTIVEENEPRRILGFEFLEKAPFTVGLAVDSSSSMLPRMADVHQSAREFLGRAANDGNRAFVVDFDTAPRLVAPTTANADVVREAVSSIRADGSTALYDAMVFSLLQLQGVSGKRALVVLSDGKDETSRYSIEDVVHVARETGASIYLVLLAGGVPSRLNALAGESGGRVWELRDTTQLDAIYDSIARELRSQYRITFQTSARDRNQFRRVAVRTELPEVKVRTSAGFFPR
ncbi:MAG TPA: VWA domain-containing protein [Thermoanaerobaculia bacterium]|nr:VWA domain-containing protein [Thermoanaerobaculia bacterium]